MGEVLDNLRYQSGQNEIIITALKPAAWRDLGFGYPHLRSLI